MKKIALFVVALSFLLLSIQSFAQENQSSDSAKIPLHYELPYPGLLPDSPFYFLRATRDKIISLLISDPLKKAEFDLLQADKRLAAGVYLGAKSKYELASTSISKGENYFESALVQAEIARKQGASVLEISGNLHLSALKHQEVLRELENKTTGALKVSFVTEEKRAQDFEKKAKEINSAK